MVLDLDVASPLRTQEDLEMGLSQISKDPDALNLFSVSPSARSPYYTMVEEGEQGYFNLIKPPDTPILARQSAPVTYDMNGSFYFYRDTFFQEQCPSAITERSLVYVMPHICFDFDESSDFAYFEYLLSQDALGFPV
jgi:CMP-N-acetylneuraminic acid synthetase